MLLLLRVIVVSSLVAVNFANMLIILVMTIVEKVIQLRKRLYSENPGKRHT